MSIENNSLNYLINYPEILTNIFSNLSLYDRKSVRLCCKSFYNACNRIPIISQEKFVIRRNHSPCEIETTLVSCEYKSLNLEFHGMQPADLPPAAVWQHCGSKIQSLLFYTSPANDELIKNILSYCPNLKHLRLCLDDLLIFFVLEIGYHLPKPFARLSQTGIVRTHLETFEVQFQGHQDWTSVIENVLDLHPNIKTFRAFNSSPNENIRTSSPLFAKFLRSSTLERLQFPLFIDKDWFKDPSLRNLRLKEILLQPSQTEKIFASLLEFFSHQKHLEIIDLQFYSPSPAHLLKKLFLYFIEEFPDVHTIKFGTNMWGWKPCFLLNSAQLSLVLNKQLQCLDVPFSVEIGPSDFQNVSPNLPFNTKLKTLVLEKTNPNISLLILKHFQNLRVLCINEVTDEVLQTILRNQVSLEVLSVTQLKLSCSFRKSNHDGENSSLTTTHSIKTLKNLQSLSINGVNLETFPRDCISEFTFPKLREFDFYYMDDHESDHLMDVASEWLNTIVNNSPELDSLQLSNPRALIRFVFREKIHLKIRKLRRISCHCGFDLEKWVPDITDTFLQHEYLRLINIGVEIFSFNRFKKELFRQNRYD